MKTLKFKTNIQCTGCLAKVTPYLNKAEGIEKWDVDINNSLKILTIETSSLGEAEIIQLINAAGYKAEEIMN